MTLGEKIKNARIERNMTQKDVVGNYITRNMLSKIENGSATPSVKTLEYLAGALGLPVGYFMTESVGDELYPGAMAAARRYYRSSRWEDCAEVLESLDMEGGYRDEAMLMLSQSELGQAEWALERGEPALARQFARKALDCNGQTLYGTPAFRARAQLVLAGCALALQEDAQPALDGYSAACQDEKSEERYGLLLAAAALAEGEQEEAALALEKLERLSEENKARYLTLQGKLLAEQKRFTAAAGKLEQAEPQAKSPALQREIYALLETCYREQEDYKKAYEYAAKLRDI